MNGTDGKKIIITFLPADIRAETEAGSFISEAAASVGVKIGRHCGGAGVCGKCRVKVEGGDPFGPLTKTEETLLSAEEIKAGVRLSCCAPIERNGSVSVIDKVESEGHSLLEDFVSPISEWHPDATGYGIAVDIGTTSVVCYLLDLEKHKVADRISFLNPQVVFGDDVISRIAFSSTSSEAPAQIRKSLTDEMEKTVGILAERNGISRNDITEITIAGNTVMEHLFAGISPESIGRSPYVPQFLYMPPFPASQAGVRISGEGVIKMIPNVAGYVGGDIVAGVAALGMDRTAGNRLLIDIGTNNEIVISTGNGIYCCAAAAGPALEGARIEYGMRASAGAIEKVTLEKGEIKCGTIAESAPTGICGSGLADAVALLLNEGIVNAGGRFEYPEKCADERFRKRLGRNKSGMVRLLLTDEENEVYLTQKDIREIQLAVGAIKVGVEVMLEKAGITKDELDEICLAGAFGSNIDVESAVRIGLLPDTERGKIRCVKNTSGFGASLALASANFFERSKEAAQKMKYVELSTLPDFQKRFIKAMSFEPIK